MSESAPSTIAPTPAGPLASGVAVIEKNLETMPAAPGVYRMLNAKGDALYVGKAKNLKKRVVAYSHPERQSLRIQRMIAETVAMEVITTHTEVEALLLESNLIKKLAPRYNILLRDDKSFPYILVTGDHAWPQILKVRGSRSRKGAYFGPFASAGAVNHTLSALERAFLLRSCSDSVFASRTRPCLLHQIKRCSAPCVERIAHDDYLALVEEARAFLSGHSRRVQADLAARMDAAAAAMEYEQAALYRDRIRALSRIQAHQDIHSTAVEEADVVALHQAAGQSCIQVFFIRAGCNYGNRAYFPAHAADEDAPDIMAAFLGQFYADKTPPKEVLVSQPPAEAEIVARALSEKAGRKVAVSCPQRGERKRLLDLAADNAREALGRRLAESGAQIRLLDGVAELFGLAGRPERIEVYDNSHIHGTNAVGAMIVAGPEGLMKNAYRTFNIKSTELTPGDDFAMMREVLTRRFQRAQKEDPDHEKGQWPDLVLIDGGAGQLGAAAAVLVELGLEGEVALVSIAKGPDRNAGRERFFQPGREPISLPGNDPVLYFLQRLRDEAHRFAIGTHRARRSGQIGTSALDEIAGIGANRKRALLRHFGSARAVSEAGLQDLEAVAGISGAMAKKIYDHFHPPG
ncbi:MAG: excinuclease ABC subunit UvrC [Magnetospirillum sp.]|nr:excinuclease ABC subunit UvrC [Magnetospirillum sp.]